MALELTEQKDMTTYQQLRVAVLSAGLSTGEQGGAERFYKGLLTGLLEIGCRAELVPVPADERSFQEIESNYESCAHLDLSDFDVVISTKTPTYAVEHPHHVMYLVHTVRVYDDMFHKAFPDASFENFVERAKLHAKDFQAISRVKARFAIGHEVANRLYRWRGINAEVLHPPLGVEGFRKGALGDYYFLPGRLHPWKRIDLLINAIKQSSMPLRLIIAGTGEAEIELKRLAKGDRRIEFLGRISDDKLIDLYANALAVPFVPLREDYGYVTLEAFASGKAVVTCNDSGEPTQFVKNGHTGLVCEPNPDSLCEALEWLYINRDDALRIGGNCARLLAAMSWPKVASRLVDAALETTDPTCLTKPTHVSVLDMQPIDPPVGGGRLRLLGLYHNLGSDIDCQYIGSYDWPGEHYRKHRLSYCLEEIDIPLSDEHHSAAKGLSSRAGGKTVIDLSFSQLGQLSPGYIEAARQSISNADVVVFSHPWIYPLVAKELTPGQIVVYDSQNVEGYLRAQLLDDGNSAEAELLRQVIHDEYHLGCRADLILACSHEDLVRFNRIYEFPADKMRVVPNGVMAFATLPPGKEDKANAKTQLQLAHDRLVAIFIGSAYGPNLDAGHFIVSRLAEAVPDVTFVIAGGVSAQLSSDKKNVIITGALNEKDKQLWLCAADIAINPMFSGSGTNIKMFDFMAASLPAVTTAVGARGIGIGGSNAIVIAQPSAESFASEIRQLHDHATRLQIGKEARLCVEEGYAWERISKLTGKIFASRHRLANQPKPFFSVVIPTYERHHQLDELIACLQNQVERDFEVIIVDQSASPWPNAGKEYIFPFVYYHSPVKGAVRARNAGATLAQGSVIAFTDDDCLPQDCWLVKARKYFQDRAVVGVEGMIVSDHLDDPDWRPVTNIDFEGIGFMTANLMVRSDVFQLLGGFDFQFDRPHFREDTDFGWRMQEIGSVPYAKEVTVFHPAQPRAIERESAQTRACFFQNDAILYRKHPDRYQQLFFTERHFQITPGFKENLLAGFKKVNMNVPEWMAEHL
ncbi:MAG: glycosyltransferase [Methylococcales bacterium]|nr:glycosyltransferase [Methylococcales bacterium]